MQRTCERCGTFLADLEPSRHCGTCALRLFDEAQARNRPNIFGLASISLFAFGFIVVWLPMASLLSPLSFFLGLIFGVASLGRGRGRRVEGVIGIVLNALVIVAFVIIGTLAGWAA
ncbi:MAG: hypothetical protein JNM17_23975 [Archangium sp.]|nr:hypothetical protein [Archangium sp.]